MIERKRYKAALQKRKLYFIWLFGIFGRKKVYLTSDGFAERLISIKNSFETSVTVFEFQISKLLTTLSGDFKRLGGGRHIHSS